MTTEPRTPHRRSRSRFRPPPAPPVGGLPGEHIYPPDRHPARCWIVVRYQRDGTEERSSHTAAWLRSLRPATRRRVDVLLEALRDVLTLQEPT